MPEAMTEIETLNERFSPGEHARFSPGAGGLTRLLCKGPLAEAEVYLHGGHVTRFRPAGGEELLYLSPVSRFEAGQPIRGGVPICFPWFAAHAERPELPPHGFARLLPWYVQSLQEQADGRIRLTLALHYDPSPTREQVHPLPPHIRAGWPTPVDLQFQVTIGAELEVELRMTNPGVEAMTCEAVLHTYLGVSDVRRVQLFGLEGADYLDKTQALQKRTQPNAPVTFTAETDRIYQNTEGPYRLVDVGARRHIVIKKSGSASTIVWNPWVDKAHALNDFSDHDWPLMACVESGNVRENALRLEPGASYAIGTRIAAEPITR